MLKIKKQVLALKHRARSRKGETLVEILASAVIIAIFFAGVLNSVVFTQQSNYTNNNKEKASQSAQEVEQEKLTLKSGPEPPLFGSAEAILDSYYGSGGLGEADSGSPEDTVNYVSSFSDPTSNDDLIQYTLALTSTQDSDLDNVTQAGYNITVRVYYTRVSNGSSYTYSEVNAFAAATVAS